MKQGNNRAPVFVLNNNTKRETGRKAQLANIAAAKAVADILSTTLGPRSMLKMLMDPMGGIVMTNDGHAILREIDCTHPAAKSMIELARMQDEEVGDGTTSVICLAGEMMQVSRPFFEREIHPTVVVQAYFKALNKCKDVLETIAQPIDLNNEDQVKLALNTCIGTKFSHRWGSLIVDLSLKACRTVMRGLPNNKKLNVEIKRFAKIEKIPGGELEDCVVLDGVMFNKDIVDPNMRRTIKNPRVILLDCPLEYKKAESQTNLEMTKESDMIDALQQEINEVAFMCNQIMKFKPDIVITEKGVSDTAIHFLLQQNISVIRRLRKTDNLRVARVTGATIVNRTDEIQESDVGTLSKLFEVRKIGDEYFSYFVECENPSACTIILRGGSKDSLNEMERNVHDALGVARNIFCDPRLVPGGGATEMELSHQLIKYSKEISGLQQEPVKAVAYALEAIPRTLIQNCGADVVRILTELRAKHSNQDLFAGVDGNKGVICDVKEVGIWEPFLVKSQVIKTSIESCCLLLRIDDTVSGLKRREENKPQEAPIDPENAETFGDARDG